MRYFRCYPGEQQGMPRPGNDIWVMDDKNRFWMCVDIHADESTAAPAGPTSDAHQVVVSCRHLAELAPRLSAMPD